MPLVENGQIVEDRYVRVADDAPIPDRVPVIVSAKWFLAEADALIRRDGSLGVAWPNDRRVAELEPWLGHVALIALHFPKFRDGRAYSQARLLRENSWLSRYAARHRGRFARSIPFPGARRLRFVRGEETRRRAGFCRSRGPLQHLLPTRHRRPRRGAAAAIAEPSPNAENPRNRLSCRGRERLALAECKLVWWPRLIERGRYDSSRCGNRARHDGRSGRKKAGR